MALTKKNPYITATLGGRVFNWGGRIESRMEDGNEEESKRLTSEHHLVY